MALFWFNACRLYHLRPFYDFGTQESAELIRRARRRFESILEQLGARVRFVQYLAQCCTEPFDHSARCFAGGEHAIPAVDLS